MILMKPKPYDYLIVGAGLFGSVCAHELNKRGKKCIVIDKRGVIGGNCFTENTDGIHVHKYGAHIFHTNDKYIWDYINQFAEFNQYVHTVIANYQGEIYSLPFNMWTFNQLWGINEPNEAKEFIHKQSFKGRVSNLEDQAVSMVGRDIYEKLIKGYTEKQWNKSCVDLPASIIKRLPVRFTWDNNYFNDRYVGIPKGGYTKIFEKMLYEIPILLETDYFKDRKKYDDLADKVIYTGPIDRFFDYEHGRLEYRSLRWETKKLNMDNFQGTAVVNYTDMAIPYTRIIEHKWFDENNQNDTIISYEYPTDYDGNNEPFYPIRDNINTLIYEKYRNMTKGMKNFFFGGRLGSYSYFDMHQVIGQALNLSKNLD